MKKQEDLLLNIINAARRIREGGSCKPIRDRKMILNYAKKLNHKEELK